MNDNKKYIEQQTKTILDTKTIVIRFIFGAILAFPVILWVIAETFPWGHKVIPLSIFIGAIIAFGILGIIFGMRFYKYIFKRF